MFEILGEIRDIDVIAAGKQIRDFQRLCKAYGKGRWRKLKGIAQVRLQTGHIITAEIHWYEAFGIGRKELKIKSRVK